MSEWEEGVKGSEKRIFNGAAPVYKGIFLSLPQIWVKRLPDNSKLRIYVTQLVRGKYVLKRRSA